MFIFSYIWYALNGVFLKLYEKLYVCERLNCEIWIPHVIYFHMIPILIYFRWSSDLTPLRGGLCEYCGGVSRSVLKLHAMGYQNGWCNKRRHEEFKKVPHAPGYYHLSTSKWFATVKSKNENSLVFWFYAVTKSNLLNRSSRSVLILYGLPENQLSWA